MKKAPLFTALCILAIALAACASSNSGSSTGATGFRSGGTRALAPEAKLALGTIKLEGTAQAVDPKTAARLIPLWQLLVQLHSSSSTAPQEVTAVMEQIKSTMTAGQVNTIEAMSFTSADVFSLLQSEAQSSGGSGGAGRFGSNGASSGRTRQGGGNFFFAGPGGGGFAGGPGGGFGGGGTRTTNANGSTSASQLTPAEQAQALQARENATSALVEDQLIRLLQTKLHSQPG